MLFSIVTTVVPATPSKNLELLPSRTPSEAHLSTSGHGIPINDDDLTGWGEASQVVFFGCFPSDLTNEKQDKSFRDLVLSKKNLSPQLNDQKKKKMAKEKRVNSLWKPISANARCFRSPATKVCQSPKC